MEAAKVDANSRRFKITMGAASIGAFGGFIATQFNTIGAAIGGAVGGAGGRYIGNKCVQKTERNLGQIEFDDNN